MGIEDCTIYRTYRCDACKALVQYEQKTTDKWKKKCPICNKNKLYLDSAHTTIDTIMELNSPISLGMIGSKNFQRAERDGTLPKGIENKKRPFWRKSKRPDSRILKNPEKFIRTGEV